MALMALTKAIIIQACEAKQELKTGELSQHIGAAFDFMIKRSTGPKQVATVKAELNSIGFEW